MVAPEMWALETIARWSIVYIKILRKGKELNAMKFRSATLIK
jgi:hypothetical protein